MDSIAGGGKKQQKSPAVESDSMPGPSPGQQRPHSTGGSTSRSKSRDRSRFTYTDLPKPPRKLMDVRQYLYGVVSKQFAGELEVLDFRRSECWIGKADDSDRPHDIGSHDSRWTVRLHGIEPPDEFDWFSFDRVGRIMSMAEACELFETLKSTRSASALKELMINARRAEYWACPKSQMLIFADTLLEMKLLTKVVLRGLADDYMMQLIAQTAPGLKHLDVSCSRFITDTGVLNLFFKSVKEKSAQYLIRSWIHKNLENMWPLVHTLEYFDFSWTNVGSLSRKMVNLLPGSYMFKRHFAATEDEAFGHHIFIRKTADYETTIHPHDKEREKLQTELHSFAGRKGVASFMKFLEGHAWKNCHLSIFIYRPLQVPVMGTLLQADELTDSVSVCIITPTPEDKRIHGLVTFWQGNLIELYSIYPINLNQLGAACPKLRILCATVTDVWRHKESLLPTLSEADLFGEPDSMMSLLNSCPNLKKVRLRVTKKPLTDDALIHALSLSMSNRYLEELWIAPGSYKTSVIAATDTDNESAIIGDDSEESKTSILSSSLRVPVGETSGTRLFHESSGAVVGTGSSSQCQTGSSKDPRVEDLVHLSASCVHHLFESCKRLKRIGNLASWNISSQQVDELSAKLAETTSGVKLVWDNNIISVGSRSDT